MIAVTPLPTRTTSLNAVPAHHIGSPPTGFENPWPSFRSIGIGTIISTKFLRTEGKTNLPVPADRKGLVEVRKPDWGLLSPTKLRATWLGHASFLIETPTTSQRGIRILFDPVFSERTSPVQWLGPKRYSPVPCKIEGLPEIDIIAISHNHYDHLDSWTIKHLWDLTLTSGRRLKIACPLGNSTFFMSLLPQLQAVDVIELDWWEGVSINDAELGSVQLVATPAQHTSARGINDKDRSLWCSWVMKCEGSKSLFFAGDTGYRKVDTPNPSEEEAASMPHCPAFKEIGEVHGPFDLALLPIGLYSPRDFMSAVHCCPEDSVCVHFDLRSRLSIGMHYGTVRGGISAQYEDVLEPPRRWREAAEKKGLVWDRDVGLCAIGETVLV